MIFNQNERIPKRNFDSTGQIVSGGLPGSIPEFKKPKPKTNALGTPDGEKKYPAKSVEYDMPGAARDLAAKIDEYISQKKTKIKEIPSANCLLFSMSETDAKKLYAQNRIFHEATDKIYRENLQARKYALNLPMYGILGGGI